MVAIHEEILACGSRTVSEAYARVFSVKAGAHNAGCTGIRSCFRTKSQSILRHALKAGHGTCLPHSFTHGVILAVLHQVSAGGMFHVTLIAMNIEACVLCILVLAFASIRKEFSGADFATDILGVKVWLNLVPAAIHVSQMKNVKGTETHSLPHYLGQPSAVFPQGLQCHGTAAGGP